MRIITLRYIHITLYLILCAITQSQNHAVDSLQKGLNISSFKTLQKIITVKDTDNLNRLIALCIKYKQNTSYDTASIYAQQAIFVANKFEASPITAISNKGKNSEAVALLELGTIYWLNSNYKQALENYLKALKINTELGNKKNIANLFLNIGRVYKSQGNYPKALENYYHSLKISEELNELKDIAISLGNIGVIYRLQNNNANALEKHNQALKIYEKLKDKNGIAGSLNNIGIINQKLGIASIEFYKKEKYFVNALQQFFKALEIHTELANKRGIGATCANIGSVYAQIANNNSIGEKFFKNITKAEALRKALDYHTKALLMNKEGGNKEGISGCNINLGFISIDLNNYSQAERYFKTALLISKEIGYNEATVECYIGLSKVDSLMASPASIPLKNKAELWQSAYNHYKQYIIYRDSLLNEEATKKTIRSEMNFEFDKKEQVIKLEQEKKEAVTKAESKKQKIIIISISIGLILVLALALVILRSLRQNQNKNKIITEQKALVEQKSIEIEHKNIEVEKKNLQITDSITYALGIQQTILPSTHKIKQIVPDSFVLFMPKDIVSGDFYWIYQNNKNDSSPIIVAAIDCTGHGVPGAFMSFIAHNLLKQIVEKNEIVNPAEILNLLNQELINTLQQNNESSIKDGFDIAICTIDYKKHIVEYAGAYNPLYLVRHNNIDVDVCLTENITKVFLEDRVLLNIKADKCSIGKNKLYNIESFTNNIIQIYKGDMLYLFTDGFADQKGGTRNKKFYIDMFQKLLMSISHLSIDEQKNDLKTTINNWKGNREQTDDILIIGIRI